jgi:hypothetical protein
MEARDALMLVAARPQTPSQLLSAGRASAEALANPPRERKMWAESPLVQSLA